MKYLLLFFPDIHFIASLFASKDSEHLLLNHTKQEPLVPTALMSDETKWLLGALEKAHFKKLSIQQLDRKIFLENYINNLDKQKLFFTASDLDEFINRYEPTLCSPTSGREIYFQPSKFMKFTDEKL